MTWIKKAYLYVVSLISLVILVVAAIMLINMALKSWVFTKADQNYYSDPALDCQTQPVAVNPDGSKVPQQNCSQEAINLRVAQNEKNRAAAKQQEAAQAVAMILVATPVFYYHWKLARKEA